jgi:Na+/H+-dicarboxylate symporter
MRKLELHWQILIGMIAGIIFGFGMTYLDWGRGFVEDWINPFGTIFVKLLKLIAIPLILASLIKGISDLKDISQFRNIGVRTIIIYITTTVIAITIGLLLVNVLQPGEGISAETIAKLGVVDGAFRQHADIPVGICITDWELVSSLLALNRRLREATAGWDNQKRSVRGTCRTRVPRSESGP